MLFAQLVDDPSSVPEEFLDEAAQKAERERLFGIVRQLVQWKNSNDARVIADARREIARSVARTLGEAPPEDRADVDAFLAKQAVHSAATMCRAPEVPRVQADPAPRGCRVSRQRVICPTPQAGSRS